jgi:excisionase family DNA binding protein
MNPSFPVSTFGVLRTKLGGELVFSVEEVAEQLDISPRAVRDLIKAGQLRAFAVTAGTRNRKWRILETALQEFIAAASAAPPPAPRPKRCRSKAGPASTFAAEFRSYKARSGDGTAG